MRASWLNSTPFHFPVETNVSPTIPPCAKNNDSVLINLYSKKNFLVSFLSVDGLFVKAYNFVFGKINMEDAASHLSPEGIVFFVQ